MWVCLIALLVSADPDPSGAKAAFDRMEQQLLQSKTLQVQLDISTVDSKNIPMSAKGRLLVAGDRMRIELDMSRGGKTEKGVLLSNGTKQQWITSGQPSQAKVMKKELGKIVLTHFSRTGVATSYTLDDPDNLDQKDDFDPAKTIPVSGFKFGKKELVEGVEAQAINYQITFSLLKEPVAATVWVDVKTNLPVKRVLVLKEGEEGITITESYTKAVLNGKIDDKEFELSK